MANSITLAKNYISLLDEVYKKASLTSVLDSDASTARQGANANEIMVPKLSMDGLADYSRNDGYIKGDVTFNWETVKFNYDRGRLFEVDSMDDEETVQLAFGRLASEFVRTKVVPEDDAFTFATLAGISGISKVATGATLSDGAGVMAAIKAGVDTMDEDEVPDENRYLFITPTNLSAIRAMDTTKSRELLDGFTQIVKVPQSRFYTAIDLYDGADHTSSEGADETIGGYVKASTGKDINFMIIHKPAVLKYWKHTASNIITPEANQRSDGYIQKYRKYGLVDAYENKLAGIYLHYKA
ncbi:hypothetical protein H8692_05605 [Mogibacterium sp. NSJ-24]|jgi:hypothetical protein|uniref:Phage major capsid protein n=1 Tax=Lentihominibacter hominis TaxID=2763645 RepID=A0A926E9J7_9FIRM|nr:hypothetical protein [Lentihominibacter hominis]MBC8568239.1 hypothetical protein [Lentihominibacter hominis]